MIFVVYRKKMEPQSTGDKPRVREKMKKEVQVYCEDKTRDNKISRHSKETKEYYVPIMDRGRMVMYCSEINGIQG